MPHVTKTGARESVTVVTVKMKFSLVAEPEVSPSGIISEKYILRIQIYKVN